MGQDRAIGIEKLSEFIYDLLDVFVVRCSTGSFIVCLVGSWLVIAMAHIVEWVLGPAAGTALLLLGTGLMFLALYQVFNMIARAIMGFDTSEG